MEDSDRLRLVLATQEACTTRWSVEMILSCYMQLLKIAEVFTVGPHVLIPIHVSRLSVNVCQRLFSAKDILTKYEDSIWDKPYFTEAVV